jgi:hypothetical protein
MTLIEKDTTKTMTAAKRVNILKSSGPTCECRFYRAVLDRQDDRPLKQLENCQAGGPESALVQTMVAAMTSRQPCLPLLPKPQI